MDVEEIGPLLGITIPADQLSAYAARLESALDLINTDCGGRFADETGLITLPPGVKMGAALLVKSMTENKTVASQSLGDMSKSFFQGGTELAARKYWARYIQASFV
jgi:hypothetical protein